MRDFLTLDVETTGLDWTTDTLHGCGIGYKGKIEYYPKWEFPQWVIDALKDPNIPKIGQNLHAFDAKFLRKAGFDVQGEFHDTKILAHLIDDTQSLKLKEMALKYLGEDSLDSKRALDSYMSRHGCSHVGQLCAKDLVDPSHPHLSVIGKYCIEDVDNTTELFWLFIDKLKEMDKKLKSPPFSFKKSPLDYYKEEAMPLEKVLFEIEYRGIRVDLNAITTIRDASLARMAEIEVRLTNILSTRIAMTEQQLAAHAMNKAIKDGKSELVKSRIVAGQKKCKFQWSNNNHVGLLFYRNCGLPEDLIFRTDKGKFKTDKETLIKLGVLYNNPRFAQILELFAEYKVHGKTASTYTGDSTKGILSKVRTVDGISRIYPEYRQTTSTGRLACTNPNMQNLKRDSEVKKFFIPDTEGEVFDDSDYSQIELRTGAHLSKDTVLCNGFINKQDLHILTASRVFGREITKADVIERQAGKRTNFLTIFDGKAYRLQCALKADTGLDFSIEQCKEFIEIWFEIYPEVRTYLDAEKEFFQMYKFCISETGRVRRLPDILYGKDLKWFKDNERGGKWVPKYVGPLPKRQQLIQDILEDKPGLAENRVTEEMIGWAARRRFEHAVKAGYNQPIQGLAASITKRAMIQLHAAGRKIANQVHDSLTVARAKGDLKAKQQLIEIMENVYQLSVPIEVDCKTLSTFHPNSKVENGL